MATLLDAVNAVGKRAHFLNNNEPLLSLSDPGLQYYIDLTVQCWNEAVVDIFAAGDQSMPLEGAESTITLVQGVREYTLPSDLVHLRFPLQDEDNGRYILEWTRGYEHLRSLQTEPDNYTGIPSYGVINPITGNLYVDFIPTSEEAGLVYQLRYDKELILSEATDTIPLSNTAYNVAIKAVSDKVREERDNEDLDALWRKQMGQAAAHTIKTPRKNRYI